MNDRKERVTLIALMLTVVGMFFLFATILTSLAERRGGPCWTPTEVTG